MKQTHFTLLNVNNQKVLDSMQENSGWLFAGPVTQLGDNKPSIEQAVC